MTHHRRESKQFRMVNCFRIGLKFLNGFTIFKFFVLVLTNINCKKQLIFVKTRIKICLLRSRWIFTKTLRYSKTDISDVTKLCGKEEIV